MEQIIEEYGISVVLYFLGVAIILVLAELFVYF